ncbi:hypothetical protein ACFRMQ_00125 [Kitasatospora sp. NPDC056783]|uniref:hypothetical protein n=1 Tax=Kitasatospora sp. NPDC056783 TaxID=3345943 RepID=UPI00367AF784
MNPANGRPAPFEPGHFDDRCEDCGAPPGAYCRPGCDSGYSADDARAHALLTTDPTPDSPDQNRTHR